MRDHKQLEASAALSNARNTGKRPRRRPWNYRNAEMSNI